MPSSLESVAWAWTRAWTRDVEPGTVCICVGWACAIRDGAERGWASLTGFSTLCHDTQPVETAPGTRRPWGGVASETTPAHQKKPTHHAGSKAPRAQARRVDRWGQVTATSRARGTSKSYPNRILKSVQRTCQSCADESPHTTRTPFPTPPCVRPPRGSVRDFGGVIPERNRVRPAGRWEAPVPFP